MWDKILIRLKKIFRFREESNGDAVKPFLEHMEDLRWTIIRMAVAQAVMTILAFYFRENLVHLLRAPLLRMDPVPKLITSGIADSVVISLELAFFAGLALALPFHIHSVASFILPALTRKERSCLLPGIGAGFLFFLAGVYIAYSYVLPATLEFFLRDALNLGLDPMWTWRAYFSFAAWLCFGFGAMCELPVVVVLLAMLGFVNFELLRRTRPYAYTIILMLTAVVAPTPDPVTFITMAVPVLLMFEACIWIVWALDKRKPSAELLVAIWVLAAWRRKISVRINA